MMFAMFVSLVSFLQESDKYIENNTSSHGDMEFIFECPHRY